MLNSVLSTSEYDLTWIFTKFRSLASEDEVIRLDPNTVQLVYFCFFVFGCFGSYLQHVGSSLQHVGSFLSAHGLLCRCGVWVFSLWLWHAGSVVCGTWAV